MNAMRTYLLAFLKALEAAIPPPPNCRHTISYAQFGSDEKGWTEELAVWINDCGVFRCWFVDDADFGKPPIELAQEITASLVQLKEGTQVIGKSKGRALR